MVHSVGQHFTPLPWARWMAQLLKLPANSHIIDPTAGEGSLLQGLYDAGYQHCSGIELDPTLPNHSPFPIQTNNFLSSSQTADGIIANPPFARWKDLTDSLRQQLRQWPLWNKHANAYTDYLCAFLLKSVETLRSGGVMVAITPEYWFNTPHAQGVRDFLLEHGHFSHLYHFSETPIFPQVNTAAVVFRYIKSPSSNNAPQLIQGSARHALTETALMRLAHPDQPLPNGFLRATAPIFRQGAPWPLAPASALTLPLQYDQQCHRSKNATLGAMAHIGNGMVSGYDKAFRLPKPWNADLAGTVPVLRARDIGAFAPGTPTPYYYLNHVPTEKALAANFPAAYMHLQPFREALQKRYSYGKPLPYWHWAMPRNMKTFTQKEPRLFFPSKMRIGQQQQLRCSLVKSPFWGVQDVTAVLLKKETREDTGYLLTLLHSSWVFEWVKANGIRKGAVLQFSENALSRIPIPRINWNDPQAMDIHRQLSDLGHAALAGKTPELAAIDRLVEKLINR